ncbi:MAG: NUDIX domain-containing protein [Actinomycetaceae bacterium]
MTTSPTPPPGRPHRMPGDGWVECGCGSRHWGLNGAAGLLAWRLDAAGGVEIALQHRAEWSHHGGTWGLPGGAIADGETPIEGGLREAAEEAGISPDSLELSATRVLQHPDWSYTTIVARADPEAEVRATDAESLEVRWASLREITGDDGLPLLPAFGAALPELRQMLGRVVLVVDSANVVGSVPDGWWRDRAGATERLRDHLETVRTDGLAGDVVGLAGSRWFPGIHLVTEGDARGVASTGAVRVHEAGGSGDDAIVAVAAELAVGPTVPDAGFTRVIVATADRGLAERCRQIGAGVIGPRAVRGR